MQSMGASLLLLLYHYPLYRFIHPDENGVNVLVIGWNEVSQAFVDAVLSVGQMDGRGLNVTVCVPDPLGSWIEYSEQRPALPEYVMTDVESQRETPPHGAYASLRFTADDGPAVADLTERCHYLLICKDDAQGLAIADGCTRGPRRFGLTGADAFLATAQNGRLMVWDGASFVPFKPLDDAPGGLCLMDMAFNAHLVWCHTPNIDIASEWDRFNGPDGQYFLSSSLSFAASIRYKLWSLGITTADQAEAARQYQQILREDADRAIFMRLLAMERRRWLMEKVTQGYTGIYCKGKEIPFEAFLARGSMKLEKVHVCIVHSEPAMPLDGERFTGKNRWHWDVPGSWDDDLDGLDRMSVELHRYMRRHAQRLKEARYMQQPDMPPVQLNTLLKLREIRQRSARDRSAAVSTVDPLRVAYNRFMYCVRSIIDGSAAYARQYRQFRDDFSSALGALNEAECARAAAELDKLDRDLFPAIESALYRNYKMNDDLLIESIPFVLTYRRDVSLAMPFDADPYRLNVNDHIFNNVASALVIKPQKLKYLYCAGRNMDPELFGAMLRACVGFLRKNGVRCEVSLAVCLDASITPAKAKRWRGGLGRMAQEGLLKSLSIADGRDALSFFRDELRSGGAVLYNGSVPLMPSNRDNAKWLDSIREYGYFEMDAASKHISADTDCAWLTYIRDRSILRIDDMFALMQGENRAYAYPDYSEPVLMKDDVGQTEPLYIRLWQIYSGKLTHRRFEEAVSTWNRLCTALDPKNARPSDGVPSLFSGKVGFDGIRGQFSPRELKNVADILGEIADIATPDGERFLSIEYDGAGHIAAIEALRANMASMLSSAGMILEVFAYFKAFETGYFDDIACGYTFYWGDQSLAESERKNEIDLILTKGFRSIMAECKARPRLEQEYYHKLSALADIFGINSTRAIIANTYSSGARNALHNENQMRRGELMDITTIFGKESIENIGNELMRIMK